MARGMLFLLPALSVICSALHAAVDCSSNAIAKPEAFGTKVLKLTAEPGSNFEGIAGNDVCYVKVTITHPGTGDSVNNWIVLPLTGWNGVFQGIGGGGYAAGNVAATANQTLLSYSAGTNDAGHNTSSVSSGDASPWALLSPGHVNQGQLLNFAHRSLHDMTVIGKAISASFYGCPVKHSYWNGCSTGGRQGIVMAQYYPSEYDGILANAPAIQWNDFSMEQQWPYTVENNEGYAPSSCQFDAVVAAILKACDGLDGLVDGIISAPGLCNFDASTLVGKSYTCDTDGSTQTFSVKAADVIGKILEGPRIRENRWLWYGNIPGANFSNTAPNIAGNSTPQPFDISDSWIRGFVAKNLSYDTAGISYAEFADIFLQSHIQYDSIIGSYSPDLRPFAKRGGKLITWQELADRTINPQGTQLYYEKVLALDPTAANFYRQYYSPGVGHCGGGSDLTPIDPISQLRAWVENGTALDSLHEGSPYPVNASTVAVVETENVRFWTCVLTRRSTNTRAQATRHWRARMSVRQVMDGTTLADRVEVITAVWVAPDGMEQAFRRWTYRVKLFGGYTASGQYHLLDMYVVNAAVSYLLRASRNLDKSATKKHAHIAFAANGERSLAAIAAAQHAPTELRNAIHELTLDSFAQVKIGEGGQLAVETSLLSICRQIRDEAMPMLEKAAVLSAERVSINFHDLDFTNLIAYFERLSPKQLKAAQWRGRFETDLTLSPHAQYLQQDNFAAWALDCGQRLTGELTTDRGLPSSNYGPRHRKPYKLLRNVPQYNSLWNVAKQAVSLTPFGGGFRKFQGPVLMKQEWDRLLEAWKTRLEEIWSERASMKWGTRSSLMMRYLYQRARDEFVDVHEPFERELGRPEEDWSP